MEQRRKRKLQNQIDLEQKEIRAQKLRENELKKPKKRTKTKDERNTLRNRPKTAKDHLQVRRAVYDKYKCKRITSNNFLCHLIPFTN